VGGYWLLAFGFWLGLWFNKEMVGDYGFGVGKSRRDGIIMEKRNKKEENPVGVTWWRGGVADSSPGDEKNGE